MTMTSIILLVLLAQATPPGQPGQARAKAKGLLSEGASLYDKGDYTGALEKFHAAYATFSSAKIWFNIGQANRDLDRPLDAIEAFQKFLDGALDASAEDRADAQASVMEIRKRLGQLTIVCGTAGAEITVDGKVVGAAPLSKPIWVVPGAHQVLATQTGAPLAVESASVGAGGNTTVVLGGAASAASAPPPVAPAVVAEPAPPTSAAAAPAVEIATTPPPPETSQGWWLGRKWTWAAGGAAVLFAGTAAVIGGLAQSRLNDLKKSCGKDSPNGQGCDPGDIDSLQTRMTAANVFWGLAGAAAVTAGILFFVEGRSVAIAPMAGESRGVVARMEF